MFLSKVSIKQPIMMTMIISVLLIFGIISYQKMNMNLMPEVSLPYISIATVYPGAGPKEIEAQLSKKIEDAVSTVSYIRKVESYSMDGISIVVIEFDMKKDIDVANAEVKDKVDQIANDLPSGAFDPLIQKIDFQEFPIMDIVLSGDMSPTELYDLADKKIKDRFAQIPGVGKVALNGGQEREIHVSIDNRIAFENFISLPQMMGILSSYNIDLPGGYFQMNDQDYSVRLKGKFKSVEEINEIEFPTPLGNKKLREFARVQDAGEKVRTKAIYFNPKEKIRNDNVVRLSIVKSANGNPVKIADEVKEILEEVKTELPNGVELQLVNDDSKFTRLAVEDTVSNVLLGVLFTSIILFIFLQDWRSTLIVIISMPTSIIATFFFMDAFGLSKNILSLMGISVTVGVLVANAVVVLENIFRHKAMGKSNKEAADHGTAEVAVAVIASTLTNVAIFLPLAQMKSMVGAMLAELAIAATAATLMSLVTAFTLTPMLASLLLREKPRVTKIHTMAEKWDRLMESIYRNILKKVLKSGWTAFTTVALSVLLFFVVVFIWGPGVKFGFFPESDESKFKVDFELPDGYNLSETNDLAKEIETRIAKYPQVKYSVTNIGKKSDVDMGVNLGMMEVYLTDAKTRDTSAAEFIAMFTEDLADIPNAKIKVANFGGMGDGAPIEFVLRGQNLDTLEKYKNMLMPKYKGIKGFINVDNSSRPGRPEIIIKPDRHKLALAGLSVQDIAYSLRASMEGLETQTQYEEGGEEYDILIDMNQETVNTPEKIKNIPIVSRMGVYRLSQLCEIEFVDSYSKILHSNKYKTIKFSGYNALGTSTGELITEINKINDNTKLPTGYSFSWGGMAEQQNEMNADFGFAFILAILLTYMLMAAMLESFIQPLMILSTIPLAIIGVILALYYSNTEMSMTGFMGVIMLIGVVVNNAILVLDFNNQLMREQGLSLKEALIESGPMKLKAIVMSTIAIILGMLPMAVGMGEAFVEMRLPLGIVSVGGLLSSTFLTLLVLPAIVYTENRIMNRIRLFFRRLFGRKHARIS